MSESRNKLTRTAEAPVRAQWQRPEVRRTRAGAAEVTLADISSDIGFS